MRTVVWLVAAAGLGAALSFTSDAAAEDGPAAEPGVFIVGDSHVQMLGPMLAGRLEDAGVRVLGHESRPGWSTLSYRREGDLRRLLVARGRPEVVVISLGGNDRPGSEAAYRRQLRWVVEQARAAGARRIIWLGPAASAVERSARAARVGAHHEQNAEWQRALLPELGVTWVDSRPMTRRFHAQDGIHFTRDGYRTWVRGVLSDLARALEPEEGEPEPEPEPEGTRVAKD
jgi:lysophospholipase L1-like esterase